MFLREFFLFEGLTSVNRDKVAKRMTQSIVTGQYWDKPALKKRPQLEELWEIALDMAEQWEDELPEHVREMEVEDRVDAPEFHALVLKWAYSRFDVVVKKLMAVPKVKGGYILHRVIRAPLNTIVRPGREIDLGIYWTYDLDVWDDLRPIWANDNDPGDDLLIQAWVDPSSVNWEDTVMANMDWFSGDREAEMRLISGYPVTVRSITDHQEIEDWSRLDLSRVHFVA